MAWKVAATAGYIRAYREMWDTPYESEVRGGWDMSSELPMEPMAPKGYSDFLMEVKTQIRQRQLQALRAVNSELLALYWWLGENISQRQNALGWGKAVVENLARDLQAEFPGRNGFSAPNLWFMRQFYNEYRDKPKLQPLVREISWSKNLLIMARCKDDLEREFYLRATARFGWSKSVLQHQLDNHSYRQYLLGQTNFDAAVPECGRVRTALRQPCAGHCHLHRHPATARKLSGRLAQP